ncbi:flagellin [Kordiimonas sediminis]|uniref:Flagellin n=1 Tax=Kordiimonas sediminis TaxID=1735581 RepID=A0A919ARB4_9PROT|nr:flagellin [Kordiimonas sediminis]GHF19615.1 flagellin [Kordiimonas sediminis]
MSFSVNTNGGALLALQNLSRTNASLETTQSRINTGLRVSSAKDDSSVYAIAQRMRATLSGYNAVKNSIDRGLSTLDVAIAAGEAISDLMIDLRGKAVAAADEGLDQDSRDKLWADAFQIGLQVDSISKSAEFSGNNLVLLDSNSTSVITSPDGSTTVELTAHDLTMDYFQFGLSTANFNNASNAASVVGLADNAIDEINTALTDFGATHKRLSLQHEFITSVSDAIEVGIGNLVDADLAKESATLQSLQVKQQLGLQALSIANQAPSSALSLFR